MKFGDRVVVINDKSVLKGMVGTLIDSDNFDGEGPSMKLVEFPESLTVRGPRWFRESELATEDEVMNDVNKMEV